MSHSYFIIVTISIFLILFFIFVWKSKCSSLFLAAFDLKMRCSLLSLCIEAACKLALSQWIAQSVYSKKNALVSSCTLSFFQIHNEALKPTCTR